MEFSYNVRVRETAARPWWSVFSGDLSEGAPVDDA
jgi:hypothetical protein